MTDLTANDKESWMKTIWDALDEYHDLIPDDLEHEDKKDDICTAMAWIREDLGLPDEVENENE